MTAYIEARSLASLNHLAANPPQYPHRPISSKQAPLTLYISRVPGTRDVILSTFKPQIKNVTVEDVANSLYYIHYEYPAPVLQIPILNNSGSPRTSGESPSEEHHISRKPLPPDTRISSSGSLQPLPSDESPSIRPPLSEHQTDQHKAPPPEGGGFERGPGPSSNPSQPGHPSGRIGKSIRVDEQADPQPALAHNSQPHGAIPRKPLGPRPLPSSQPNETRHVLLPSVPLIETPPDIPPARASSPLKGRGYTPLFPFTLIIIRRDPSSGHQWNVGRISSYELHEKESNGRVGERARQIADDDDRPQTAPTITIHIETSGYCKFRNMPAKANFEHRPGSSGTSNSGALRNSPGSPINAEVSVDFARQVVLTYVKTWATNLKEKFRRSESESSAQNLMSMSHSREQSSSSADWNEVVIDETAPVTQPGPGLKPHGYMFLSPWDSRCEFRTGNGGRSIKCRHVLPESPASLSNPLAPQSDRRSSISNPLPGTSNSLPVSELRFNLPSVEMFKSRSDLSESTPEHLHGHFSRLFKVPQDGGSDEADEIVSPFDLHLGREKAGGGNRGKRAKLGKLIVYDEGLKMLDLVIAANMGIWWGAWERSF